MTIEEMKALPDGLYEGIPEDVYHKCDYFSASYAKDLIQNPALAQEERKAKKCFDIGSAVHALKLEGRDTLNKRFAFVPGDAPAKPTNRQLEAKKPAETTIMAIQWWELFEKANSGKIFMAADDREIVEGCVKAIDAYPCVIKRGMFQKGMNEVTIIYTDFETGIRCKSRLDHLSADGFVDDLKTAADTTVYGFGRAIAKLRYYLQAGAYFIAANTVGIEIKGVRLCGVCSKPPFQVIVGEFSEAYLNIGQMEYCRALNIEKECRELGFYPNLNLPQSLPSLYDVYNPDGSVRADDDVYEIWDVPAYM